MTFRLAALIAAGLLAAACGSSSSSRNVPAASAGGSEGSAASSNSNAYGGGSSQRGGAGTVSIVAKKNRVGDILGAGPKKLTVYLFGGDRGSTSSCSGQCAHNWPPVIVSGSAKALPAAQQSLLGTTVRSDGTKQLTYKGHPVYYFMKDKDGGDAYGEGVKAFGADWYALAPSGVKIDKS